MIIVKSIGISVVIIQTLGSFMVIIKTIRIVYSLSRPSINACISKIIDIIVVLALILRVIVKPVARDPGQSDNF